LFDLKQVQSVDALEGQGVRDYSFLREIKSPLTSAQLRPLAPQCERVQFSEPLTDRDHKKLAIFLRNYPKVLLRVYGHHWHECDLDFLRHYGHIRHFSVDVFSLASFDGLRYLSPGLESLGLGLTRSKSHALAFLLKFPGLRTLFVEGHSRDCDVIGRLARLQELVLTSIPLPDLSSLRPLGNLVSLGINLGGTKNLECLPEIGRLRSLRLFKIRGLTELQPIASVRTLQYMLLHSLRNVKSLPSFKRLSSLRRVRLETMKGLTDLEPVAQAPALTDLEVVSLPQLDPEAFRSFVGHPTLRRAHVYLGSNRKNKQVVEILGLPPVEGEFQFDEAAVSSTSQRRVGRRNTHTSTAISSE
jgi:hypothetical protein